MIGGRADAEVCIFVLANRIYQACSGTSTFAITKPETFTANNLNNIAIPGCPTQTPNVRCTISDGTPTTSTATTVNWTAPSAAAAVSVKLEGQDLSGSFKQLDSKNINVVIPSTDTSSLDTPGSCAAGFGKDDLYTAVVKYNACNVDFSGVSVQERDDGANPNVVLNDCNLVVNYATGGPALPIDATNKYSFDRLSLCFPNDAVIPAGGCHFAVQTQWRVGPNLINYQVHRNSYSIPAGNSTSNPPGGFSRMTTSRTP